MTRPVIIAEESIPATRAITISGDRAVCGAIGGPACMCQPGEHGGKGACGKPIAPVIDADIQNAYLAARGRV